MKQTQTIPSFLDKMKARCEVKAKQIAAIELQNWTPKHEADLKQYYGFSDSKLEERKIMLIIKAQ